MIDGLQEHACPVCGHHAKPQPRMTRKQFRFLIEQLIETRNTWQEAVRSNYPDRIRKTFDEHTAVLHELWRAVGGEQ